MHPMRRVLTPHCWLLQGGGYVGPGHQTLFKAAVMLCHAGWHSSSTVHLHLHRCLHLLMFRHDIYGHVWQPTHTSVAVCSEHTFVFGTNVSPDSHSREGHTCWGRHRGEVTCTLDEISLILKGNSNHSAFVKSAQCTGMMTDAVDNWCWVQGCKQGEILGK